MKSVNTLYTSFLIFVFWFSTQKAQNQEFELERRTDKNGYTYDYVKGDPTHTRMYLLENGLSVYLSKNTAQPQICARIKINSGSADDPHDHTGLAHYLEHMLFKGTDRFGTNNWKNEAPLLEKIAQAYQAYNKESNLKKKEEIYRKIDLLSQEASKFGLPGEYNKMMDRIGAQNVNAYTSLDKTLYKSEFPSYELKRWLIIESERFRKLVPRSFASELEVIYQEYNTRGLPDEYYLNEALFPTHPYGKNPIIGWPLHLRNPSIKAIHQFFDTYYVPNNMHLVLTGDLDYDETIRQIDYSFGKLPPKALPERKFPLEKPMNFPVKRSRQASFNNLVLAYRLEKGRSDFLWDLLNALLNDTSVGLFSKLKYDKKLLDAYTHCNFYKNYSVHYLFARPEEDQTIEQARDLLLAQIEHIKQGKIQDDTLKIVQKQLEQQIDEYLKDALGLADLLSDMEDINHWANYLKSFRKMLTIDKQGLAELVKREYKNNYAVLYKVESDLNYTSFPAALNTQEAEGSKFFKKFSRLDPSIPLPEHIDFNKEINTLSLQGMDVEYVKNTEKDGTSQLALLYEIGTDHLAILYYLFGYLNTLDEYKQMKKKFAELSFFYDGSLTEKGFFIRLKGPEKNLQAAVKELEKTFENLKPDLTSYENYVKDINKAHREDFDNNIFQALIGYTRDGDLRQRELRALLKQLTFMNPSDLIQCFKQALSAKHRLFYYGAHPERLGKILPLKNLGSQPLKWPKKQYDLLLPAGNYYWVDQKEYDTVYLMFSRSLGKVNSENWALLKFLEAYFKKILFDEVREKRALSYNFHSSMALEPVTKNSFLDGYLQISPDKLLTGLRELKSLLEHLALSEESFQEVKINLLKELSSSRLKRVDIFWIREQKKRYFDVDYDDRRQVYERIKKLTPADFAGFIKGINLNKYNISVMTDKKNLNLEALKEFGETRQLTKEELLNE